MAAVVASPTAVATFRVDQDGSRAEGVRSLPIGMHHADWATSEPDELRSELVTALRDETGAVLVAGFLGGWEHDGTFRVRPARDGSEAIELWIEAFFGGAISDAQKARVRKLLDKNIAGFKRLAKFAPYIAGEAFTLADCAAARRFP